MRGMLRFVKWKRTRSGHAVSKCQNMRRTTVDTEPFQYRFRCMGCRLHGTTWVYPEDGTSTTTQKVPLTVRLHILAHFPGMEWPPRHRTVKPKPGVCPNCNYDLNAWRIPPRPGEDDE